MGTRAWLGRPTGPLAEGRRRDPQPPGAAPAAARHVRRSARRRRHERLETTPRKARAAARPPKPSAPRCRPPEPQRCRNRARDFSLAPAGLGDGRPRPDHVIRAGAAWAAVSANRTLDRTARPPPCRTRPDGRAPRRRARWAAWRRTGARAGPRALPRAAARVLGGVHDAVGVDGIGVGGDHHDGQRLGQQPGQRGVHRLERERVGADARGR